MTRREFVGGFGAEVKFFAAVLVLLTGICAITATASFGDTIDATTPCSVAIPRRCIPVSATSTFS